MWPPEALCPAGALGPPRLEHLGGLCFSEPLSCVGGGTASLGTVEVAQSIRRSLPDVVLLSPLAFNMRLWGGHSQLAGHRHRHTCPRERKRGGRGASCWVEHLRGQGKASEALLQDLGIHLCVPLASGCPGRWGRGSAAWTARHTLASQSSGTQPLTAA